MAHTVARVSSVEQGMFTTTSSQSGSTDRIVGIEQRPERLPVRIKVKTADFDDVPLLSLT